MVSSLPELHGVAHRLRHVRERLGLTRAELQAELRARGAPNCSEMTIRRNEAGVRSPTVDELAALAAVAKVPVRWLVEGRASGVVAPDPSASEPELVNGILEALLARAEEGGGEHRAQEAFERAETRLGELRESGRLGDAGWKHWLAVRRGAVLAGGYRPEER